LDKRTKALLIERDKEYQYLFTLNESIVYKTNNGYIHYDSKRAKIINTELLYTNPENNVCTHIILYIDQALIAKVDNSIPTTTINTTEVNNNYNYLVTIF
jgi:hypothetical protein